MEIENFSTCVGDNEKYEFQQTTMTYCLSEGDIFRLIFFSFFFS